MSNQTIQQLFNQGYAINAIESIAVSGNAALPTHANTNAIIIQQLYDAGNLSNVAMLTNSTGTAGIGLASIPAGAPVLPYAPLTILTSNPQGYYLNIQTGTNATVIVIYLKNI